MSDDENRNEYPSRRLFQLAYRLAMVHVSDGDILGKNANELLKLLDDEGMLFDDSDMDD